MRLDELNSISEAKFAKPRIVYHGTRGDLGRSILKQGMDPNPKSRVWADDPDANQTRASRASLSGSYWTSNLMTAMSSASTLR